MQDKILEIFVLLAYISANAFLLHLSARYVAKISMVKWWHSLLIVVVAHIVSLVLLLAAKDTVLPYFAGILEQALRAWYADGGWYSLRGMIMAIEICAPIVLTVVSCILTIAWGNEFWACEKRQSAVASLLWTSVWLVFWGILNYVDHYLHT